jgi:hypothetical protein
VDCSVVHIGDMYISDGPEHHVLCMVLPSVGQNPV